MYATCRRRDVQQASTPCCWQRSHCQVLPKLHALAAWRMMLGVGLRVCRVVSHAGGWRLRWNCMHAASSARVQGILVCDIPQHCSGSGLVTPQEPDVGMCRCAF
eukprot:jgi/Ulvmu1/6138/UM027_0116.1